MAWFDIDSTWADIYSSWPDIDSTWPDFDPALTWHWEIDPNWPNIVESKSGKGRHSELTFGVECRSRHYYFYSITFKLWNEIDFTVAFQPSNKIIHNFYIILFLLLGIGNPSRISKSNVKCWNIEIKCWHSNRPEIDSTLTWSWLDIHLPLTRF